MATRTTRQSTRVAYAPAPAPSGGGLVDALFSHLERQRLEAAGAAIAAERQELAALAPRVATGSPDAIVSEMTDELSRRPAGAWARRLVRGCLVALRRRADGRRELAIAVPEPLSAARGNEVDWIRSVSSFCLWSGVIWEDEPREALAPVFHFVERDSHA
jgi:hypothetical protein